VVVFSYQSRDQHHPTGDSRVNFLPQNTSFTVWAKMTFEITLSFYSTDAPIERTPVLFT
jgi:hypothetical protein